MTIPEHRYTAFLVGSLLTSYPDPESRQLLNQLLASPAVQATCAALADTDWQALTARLVAVDDLVPLQADYVDLFDRSRQRNSLYETEYGANRIFRKPRELADLAGFYQAFGLRYNTPQTLAEMPDHVAVELEFYALLLLKQRHLEALADQEGIAIVIKARESFLADHLGRFPGALAACPEVAGHPFYGPATRWTQALVAAECAALAVTPEPLTIDPTQAEPESVACGACTAHPQPTAKE